MSENASDHVSVLEDFRLGAYVEYPPGRLGGCDIAGCDGGATVLVRGARLCQACLDQHLGADGTYRIDQAELADRALVRVRLCEYAAAIVAAHARGEVIERTPERVATLGQLAARRTAECDTPRRIH